MMTRQLATLLKASIPLVDCLQAVSEQVDHHSLAEILADARNIVNEGGSLTKALSKYPKVFNKIYISMVEAGEMSGTLDVILLRLAEFTESQNKLKSKIKAAMMYPVIMIVMTLGILVFLFTFIVPPLLSFSDRNPA